MSQEQKPLVVLTGAAGRLGRLLAARLSGAYRIAGLDLEAADADFPILACDLSDAGSIETALAGLTEQQGSEIAAVIHLAAFFDFSGEDNPLYRSVNVEGTRNLVRQLAPMGIGRFIYASTMLVHAPGAPGDLLTEETPIDPRWAYPKSKAEAEAVIAEEAGDMPYAILRLAGVYDTEVAVPTLANQIARIYERDLEASVYAGNLKAGQSLLHADDMGAAIERTIERRAELPQHTVLVIGEPGAAGYEDLQTRIGRLIHGEKEWSTLVLPKPVAKLGAFLQNKAEPLVPDSIDQGEAPFIRPFMIAMASDHYALDTSRARDLLDWAPEHRIEKELPAIIARLKADPIGWYEANGIRPAPWMETAAKRHVDPEKVRVAYEADVRGQHRRWIWAHCANVFLGAWLITSPAILGYRELGMTISDIVAGLLLIVFAIASLDWRLSLARFGAGAVGLWVLFAPLVFWTPSAAAYLNGTVIGALAIAFATASRPFPLVSPIARQTGPDIPPGWDFSPSTFLQRAPIIALALVGFFISRILTAYQLGHVDGVWDPFFAGVPDNGLNGTEEIITSEVSKAWPLPDAGIGAATYMLEIITGLIGSARRWRTMPWLVFVFGLMIVPLGIISVTFIIIQPIVLGTWCTLCLLAAAAMVTQIPYSLDELVATGQFLHRKYRQKAFWRAFIFGDTDEGEQRDRDDFDAPLKDLVRKSIGGVGLPWTLAVSILIGLLLMMTRLFLGAEGAMANADHLIGALVIVVSATALAEVARPVRLLNALLGSAVLIMPFVLGASIPQVLFALLAGGALIALSLPRGRIAGKYGELNRYLF